MAFNRQNSIRHPRITEKASLVGNKNVYVFEVKSDATKTSIIHDIKTIYKVTPLKVNVVNTPAKKRIMKGKIGKTTTPKKAYVYLKAGDSINIS